MALWEMNCDTGEMRGTWTCADSLGCADCAHNRCTQKGDDRIGSGRCTAPPHSRFHQLNWLSMQPPQPHGEFTIDYIASIDDNIARHND